MANLRPVVLLACALTLLVPLNLHANQLLLEAGFEPPACSDSTWVQTSATYACVNAVTHSGSWSLWGNETDPANLGRFFQLVNLVPGKSYTIDGWIMTDNVVGGSGVVLGLAYVDMLGVTPADGHIMDIGFVTGTTGWTYYKSASFLLPAMPGDASNLVFYGDFSNATGMAWFDDLSLEPVPEPTSILLMLTGVGVLARKLGRKK